MAVSEMYCKTCVSVSRHSIAVDIRMTPHLSYSALRRCFTSCAVSVKCTTGQSLTVGSPDGWGTSNNISEKGGVVGRNATVYTKLCSFGFQDDVSVVEPDGFWAKSFRRLL
jgi:hypothetical protein